VDAEETAGFVHVRVIDSGIGMDTETIREILSGTAQSRFGTAGEKGSGLGLRLTREFLAMLGSELEIGGMPGDGSRFSFRLPGTGR
jgi:signal transduction histidine kinase